ncbi:unnamed protein product [Phyllotreta striolata]|uniref:Uncharacterized protein n=1 Tax=Phyllotreta striolata TaxID=444603 RepID=A0A9N9XPT1_PHYSR|nr:unnamed protein product [Phyllotreta striolata]
MSCSKILQTLTILILLNITASLPGESEADAGSLPPYKQFLQTLPSTCFLIKNETYKNTGGIAENLNGKLDARLFISTATGLRVDTKTFANLLTDCLRTQANIHLPTEELRNNVQMLANFVFDKKEISYEEVTKILHSKHNAQNIIQQLLLDLIIAPLKTGVNNLLENAGNIVKFLADMPSENHNETNTTEMSLAKAKTRGFFSGLIESTLVSPIRSTVNSFVSALNGTINYFYTTTPTDSIIKKPIIAIINEIVRICRYFLNKIHATANSIFNLFGNGSN